MIHDVEINGETLLIVDGQAYVRSRSDPHTWYQTDYDACECTAFRYRRDCRHSRAVSAYNRERARTETLDRRQAMAEWLSSYHQTPSRTGGKAS